ncbi:hypothetical protein [Helicobacter monodelphidis]|nr:hypothetical protein [Helicobacter sp. 15-1451]
MGANGDNSLSSTTDDIIPQSTEDPILQRALELQTKQQKGELDF